MRISRILFRIAFIFAFLSISCSKPEKNDESEVIHEALNFLSSLNTSGDVTYYSVIKTTSIFCQPLNSEEWLGPGCVFDPYVVSGLLTKSFDRLPKELELELVKANLKSKELTEDEVSPHKLVSQKYYSKFKEEYWPAERKKHPNWFGFIEITKPAFSSDKRTALLYVMTDCGVLCGEGRFLILERIGDVWRVTSTRRTYMS